MTGNGTTVSSSISQKTTTILLSRIWSRYLNNEIFIVSKYHRMDRTRWPSAIPSCSRTPHFFRDGFEPSIERRRYYKQKHPTMDVFCYCNRSWYARWLLFSPQPWNLPLDLRYTEPYGWNHQSRPLSSFLLFCFLLFALCGFDSWYRDRLLHQIQTGRKGCAEREKVI